MEVDSSFDIKSLRSTISQPNLTHFIDYENEGCALQRTNIDIENWNEVDCGRCSMSYSGIGNNKSRSLLQNECIERNGITGKQLNKWLYLNARKPLQISKKEWRENCPRVFYIHKNLIYKRQSLIQACIDTLNELLLENEQVSIKYDLKRKPGHIFNVGKINNNYLWYIDAQYNINPGEKLLEQYLAEVEEHSIIESIGIIITPWQASQLLDEDGYNMVYDYHYLHMY